MHIPDGILSPSVALIGYAGAGAAVTVALNKAGKSLRDEQIPLLGVTAAFIFAAQMLNFPIGAGTSGHFLGALLAALLVGPLNACLVMTVVLTLQCFLFADGGLTALGCNIFNMSVVGGLLAYAVFAVMKAVLPRRRWMFFAAVAVASWFSIVAASAACAAELALSGTVPFKVVFTAMTAVHAVIGIGEALITTATLSVVLAARPDLIEEIRSPRSEVQETGGKAEVWT